LLHPTTVVVATATATATSAYFNVIIVAAAAGANADATTSTTTTTVQGGRNFEKDYSPSLTFPLAEMEPLGQRKATVLGLVRLTRLDIGSVDFAQDQSVRSKDVLVLYFLSILFCSSVRARVTSYCTLVYFINLFITAH
jgi:hypothetical protein